MRVFLRVQMKVRDVLPCFPENLCLRRTRTGTVFALLDLSNFTFALRDDLLAFFTAARVDGFSLALLPL